MKQLDGQQKQSMIDWEEAISLLVGQRLTAMFDNTPPHRGGCNGMRAFMA